MIFDIVIILLLMAVAIVLLLLELFLLPGAVVGVCGAFFALGGIAYGFSLGTAAGCIVLGASVVLFGLLFAWLMRRNSLSKIALKTAVESKLPSMKELGVEIGDTGTTLSRLAPTGLVNIGQQTLEARSQAGMIDEDKPIVVVRVEGYQVVVKVNSESNK